MVLCDIVRANPTDCIGKENCKIYESLMQARREGRSDIDVCEDIESCGRFCVMGLSYESPYRDE